MVTYLKLKAILLRL